MKEALFAQTSCIILSAGSSARMGTHKALLQFDSERTFIQKITGTYLQAGVEQIIVVINTELYRLIKESNLALSEKTLLVINDKPELGRFYSIQTSINSVKSGNYCFFQNIDNPLTSEELLRELIIHKDEADVIMPTYRKKSGHPVLISPLIVSEIFNAKDPVIRIDLFLKSFNILDIETTDGNISININTPEDYLAVFNKP